MLASGIVFINHFLSLSVILISLISKLPQIVRVVNIKTANGISLFSLSLEVFRLLILWTYNYCYGYPILTYLDYPLLIVQQSILFYFVLKYKNLLTTQAVCLWILVYLTIILFMTEILPKIILEYVIVLCPLLSIVSRFTQVFKIIQLRNADGISLTSWILTAYIGFARICTTLMGSRDKMLLFNSLVAVTGSTSICLSAFYYQKLAKKSA